MFRVTDPAKGVYSSIVNCARCGVKAPKGAAFCPSCGGPLPPAAPATGYGSNARSVWMGAGIAGAALAAALVGLKMAGVLQFGAPKSADSLQVMAPKTTPSLARPGVKIVMPNDIRDWL